MYKRQPADCVKVGIRHLMQDRPDVVFSGINCGYNVGVDILYSGTVGAAMEALLNGIPAVSYTHLTYGCTNFQIQDSIWKTKR